jgi:hypothetical protein
VHGATTVVVATGDLLTGDSLPSPDTSTHGSPTWTCRGRPKAVGLLQPERGERVPDLILGFSPGDSGGAFSARALKDGDAGNCSALAVIVQLGSAYQRDLVLLATGAIVSLGFTILIELFLRLRYMGETT